MPRSHLVARGRIERSGSTHQGPRRVVSKGILCKAKFSQPSLSPAEPAWIDSVRPMVS